MFYPAGGSGKGIAVRKLSWVRELAPSERAGVALKFSGSAVLHENGVFHFLVGP